MKMASTSSQEGTVRRYVLVGVGVVLLEEVCYHASCYDGNKLKV